MQLLVLFPPVSTRGGSSAMHSGGEHAQTGPVCRAQFLTFPDSAEDPNKMRFYLSECVLDHEVSISIWQSDCIFIRCTEGLFWRAFGLHTAVFANPPNEGTMAGWGPRVTPSAQV